MGGAGEPPATAGMSGAGAGGADQPAGQGGAGGMDGTAGGGGTDALPPLPDDKALPLVFVHGYAGSASQYTSQKMRFVANGYPADRILAYEHDGAGLNTAAFIGPLDAIVDQALSRFGASKVYLVGHSRGTFVSSMYLGDAQRAAKVAKYIAIDGGACPAAVPCIAPSQAMFPGQKHVEVCTSKESFIKQYEFLLGEAPKVTDIVRQAAPVVVSGRAVNFPANTGRVGDTVKVFALDSMTGARSKAEPEAMFTLAADGNFGPVTVSPDQHYEFELSTMGFTTHYYAQRFLRSTDFFRLASGPSDSATRMNTNRSVAHSTVIASRMREWLESDVLEVSTKTASGMQPPVNAITAAGGAALSIAYHIHDAAASPGNSTVAALPFFSGQPFQYGVDIFMPAADPPTGVITVRSLPRGDMARPQVLNVPNWPSSSHSISLVFSDFAQD
jgi:pimeloyl-ACP methyl ester carboxylesterase